MASWVLCFKISHKVAIGVLTGAEDPSEDSAGENILPPSHAFGPDSSSLGLRALESFSQFFAT